MTSTPQAYEPRGGKRELGFYLDYAQRVVRRVAAAASAIAYPLGDVVALVRRRLADRLRATDSAKTPPADAESPTVHTR